MMTPATKQAAEALRPFANQYREYLKPHNPLLWQINTNYEVAVFKKAYEALAALEAEAAQSPPPEIAPEREELAMWHERKAADCRDVGKGREAAVHERAAAIVRLPAAVDAREMLSHSNLCRLSRVFNQVTGLNTLQEYRINEWLKVMIGEAGSRENVE
jgi:hypothetical protein